MFNVYGRLLFVIAVLPGLLLLLYVYKQDKIEKEPVGLIVKLLLFGALSTIGAFILEMVGSAILGHLTASGPVYNLLMYFIVVACSEEGMKMLFLKMGSWKTRAFDYVFDGIVYAVCVGLGFAVLENIEYSFNYGISTALLRAVTAVPAHTIFAIFMGHYYGLAKVYEAAGCPGKRNLFLRLAFLVPVLIHGFYDFSASSDGVLMMIVFFIFLVGLDLLAIRRIHIYSNQDRPIDE